MKVITMESAAYHSLVGKIDLIARYIEQDRQSSPVEEIDPAQVWIGNEEAAEMLHISTRTLQRLRTKGEITYSIKGGKAQYTLFEVRRMTSGKVFRSKKAAGDTVSQDTKTPPSE